MKAHKRLYPPFLKGLLRGAKAFLEDIASFNNFLILSMAYFIGVGTSAMGIRFFEKGKTKKTNQNPDTYWTDLNIGGKPSDSYYRPF
jgi:hypothetical protein